MKTRPIPPKTPVTVAKLERLKRLAPFSGEMNFIFAPRLVIRGALKLSTASHFASGVQ